MKQIVILFLTCLCTFSLTAQELSMEKKNAIIKTYEGFPPVPFEAPDMNETKHFLPDYKGKVVLMSFWNTTSPECAIHISALNKLTKEYEGKEIVIVSFADEEATDLKPYLEKQQVNYPIIPNSKGLGEMAYAGELGSPRLFVIDQDGIIQRVYVSQSGDDETKAYTEIKVIIDEYLK